MIEVLICYIIWVQYKFSDRWQKWMVTYSRMAENFILSFSVFPQKINDRLTTCHIPERLKLCLHEYRYLRWEIEYLKKDFPYGYGTHTKGPEIFSTGIELATRINSSPNISEGFYYHVRDSQLV